MATYMTWDEPVWTNSYGEPRRSSSERPNLVAKIDDAVEEWHNSKSNLPLLDYLGMSREQFGRFIKGPDTLTVSELKEVVKRMATIKSQQFQQSNNLNNFLWPKRRSR